MGQANAMQIQFKSSSVNEAFARVVVASFFSQLDPTVDELEDGKMEVSEAVTNCIIHVYNREPDHTITIKWGYEDQDAWLEITDEGKGIADIEEAMEPFHTTALDDERAGLGFTVMQSMMDEVKVCSNVGQGTTVKLTKTFY